MLSREFDNSVVKRMNSKIARLLGESLKADDIADKIFGQYMPEPKVGRRCTEIYEVCTLKINDSEPS